LRADPGGAQRRPAEGAEEGQGESQARDRGVRGRSPRPPTWPGRAWSQLEDEGSFLAEPEARRHNSSLMAAPFSWIRPEPHGIHVVPADCWIDPAQPVANALVTHGHADHARGGHGRPMATAETLAIMELRYQTREGALPVAYGETIALPGGVKATFVPAGHVLGSAQIVLEHAGERVVVTGDYKRRPDPTCPPFECVPCDVLVTEATF